MTIQILITAISAAVCFFLGVYLMGIQQKINGMQSRILENEEAIEWEEKSTIALHNQLNQLKEKIEYLQEQLNESRD